MKSSRLVAFITLVIILLCTIVSSSLALELNLSSKTEAELYPLYREIESQLLLKNASNINSYKAVVDYDDYERNPFKHTDEQVYFTGTVIQVAEGRNHSVVYRIAMNGNLNKVFFIEYKQPDGCSRILEDDSVTVYATFSELKTYTSTTNLSVTVPYCKAQLIVFPTKSSSIKSASVEELRTAKDTLDTKISAYNKPDSSGNVKITKTNYNDYARRENRHLNEKITFTGKVLQAVDGQKNNIYRIAVDGDSNCVIYTIFPVDKDALRILDGDQVTVTGVCNGLYTYESTRGGDITIPSCTATKINIKGYTEPASPSKDSSGYSYITKSNFSTYSRNPGKHTDEKIRFNGKVIQVIENSKNTTYRITVDSDSNSVFLVTLPTANKTTRVLENDKVTVMGVYSGIYSYESTMGAIISVPSCIADKITIEGYSSSAQSNSSGKYTVTKSNYDSFARNESTYMNSSLTFTAKVIQVIEGSASSSYRIAIDSSNSCMFYATIKNSDLNVRLLENDVIKVTASTYTGLFSYNSTMGGKITIPSCNITKYTVNGYTVPASKSPDSQGYYEMTKYTYGDYARRPSVHENEKITLTGRVIQVVERANGDNLYRITVDSDYSCVILVSYKLPSKTSRILEDDVIVLKGKYDGLYTYTTTMGSAVTIPYVVATSISRPSTTATSSYTVKVPNGGNVRSDAGSEYNIIGYADAGSTYQYLGEKKNTSTGSVWYKISYRGMTGYISSSIAELIKK